MRAVDPGFKSDNVLTLRLSHPGCDVSHAGRISRFYYQLTTRLATVPGVQAVGAASKLPLAEAATATTASWVEDHPRHEGRAADDPPTVNITQDYFTAMGIPIVEGRDVPGSMAAIAPRTR